jgi:hypothetical protein
MVAQEWTEQQLVASDKQLKQLRHDRFVWKIRPYLARGLAVSLKFSYKTASFLSGECRNL